MEVNYVINGGFKYHKYIAEILLHPVNSEKKRFRAVIEESRYNKGLRAIDIRVLRNL